MRERDRKLLEYLEKFRCLTSSQVASLLFQSNAHPKIVANRTLLRMFNKKYILRNSDTAFSDYIYFINPSPIKTDSQKISHYLEIVNGYITCLKHGAVLRYDVEEKIPKTKFRADAYCHWLDKNWFMEFQCSTYSAVDLHKKIGLYLDYYESGEWKEGLGLTTFPNVLIVGKTNLRFDPSEYPFPIHQVKSIDDMSAAIKAYKTKKLEELKVESKKVVKKDVKPAIKSSNGGISFKFE